MNGKYNSIIPKNLELWVEDQALKYRVEEKNLNSEGFSLLKSNKKYFHELLNKTKSKRIKVFPLSQNQKALWFIYKVNPEIFSYNISLSAEIPGSINDDILKKAIISLIEKHQLLRTVFTELEGDVNIPCQVVLDKVVPDIEQIDVADLDERQLQNLINEKYKIPFDLKKGPLFRLTIVNLKKTTILSFVYHHIICDAISLRNLFDEFIKLYEQLTADKCVVDKSLNADYNDFIFDQLEFLNSRKGEESLDYWVRELSGCDHILNIANTKERPALHQFRGGTMMFKIEREKLKMLRSIARNNNTTFNVFLLTIYEFFLSYISGQHSFCVGVPASGRLSKKYANTFGYFINILPLKCDLGRSKTFIEFLAENRDRVYKSLDNQNIPFPVIVGEISPKRDLSRTPLFQVLFNYMNNNSLGCLRHFLGDPESDFSSWGPVRIKPFKIFDQEGQVDLTLEIIDDDDKLLCALKYNDDLFDDERIKTLKDDFLKIVDLIIKDLKTKPDWLKDKTKSESEQIKYQINITGTFTAEPIIPYLDFWMNEIKMESNIENIGYNQVFQQLLNPLSAFNTNDKGFNICFIRLEDVVLPHIRKKNLAKISDKIEELTNALDAASEINQNGKYFVVFCPGSDRLKKIKDVNTLLDDWEDKISEHFSKSSNVHILSSQEVFEKYAVNDYYEPLGEEHGHIPYTEEYFISLATLLARKIRSFYSLPVKAIVVDCDNTLWKGVVAEDGAPGVSIGPPEIALQDFLLAQYNSGVLICLCSKNREEDVWEVFERNMNMVLKKEHIAFNRINWNSKTENLIELANEINIGLDSIVFIDDSPMECAEIRNNIPEIFTIQVPENGFDSKQLRNIWIFDKLKVTEEDRTRTEKYKEEVIRNKFRTSVQSYKEFISGLQLEVRIQHFRKENIPRISQLTYRTNQFNFTTTRKSESEIRNLMQDRNYDCYQVSLSDRFGDYGLTGVVIVNKSAGYQVETFLLSCRVLGKGVEHRLISFLGERAKFYNADILKILFKKTEKNIPAENFLFSNFGDMESKKGDTLLFNIPVTNAINFTFDPEISDHLQEVSDKKPEKTKYINKTVKDRNDFNYRVLEKYLSLNKIVSEINNYDTDKMDAGTVQLQPFEEVENKIFSVWQQVLKRKDFGSGDNFFDIGGSSVLIPQIVIKLQREYSIKINIVDLFQFPTVKELASFIESGNGSAKTDSKVNVKDSGIKNREQDIAIIGMSGRFPEAESLEEFWEIVSSGKEAITFYSREDLERNGVDRTLLDNKNYVYANGNLDSADKFDETFFGITPKEADLMDPQHRIFLETCYHALETAGYSSDRYPGDIGVFAGCGMNNYLLKNLYQYPALLKSFGEFQTIINNNSDFLTTRISYKLNLTGPSLDIQTACSTSLVAVHVACQNILDNTCDMALAGGVFIQIPHAKGYLYEPGGIFSPDGHCAPFDKNASGTLFGEGAGVLVLKKLDYAIRDRDNILAVIKGSAINNDGSNKVGYMAPSVNGQTDVIRKALSAAEIKPETISYIETHGTGTLMGDPIEVAALGQVFGDSMKKRKYCNLGSIKANIGHLDAAAGVAGVIKTVLMLNNKKLPPLANFNNPNPELHLDETPFLINTTLVDWNSKQRPLRAGVSSFGIGGTNAHCILEEGPETERKPSKKKYHLLPVTAKTQSSLENLTQKIEKHISDSNQDIADIAFTLQQGRTHFKHRTVLVYETKNDGRPIMQKQFKSVGLQSLTKPRVVFMFTGQGSQYPGMTKNLYEEFHVFRDIVDKCQSFLKETYNLNIIKYIREENNETLKDEINNTSIAQPLLFVVQYGLAKLLEESGIKPDAVIGHSIGEYAAACLAGVFSFEDALRLVTERGRLMQAQETGAMLSVNLSYEEVLPFLDEKVNIAVKNAPNLNVVSGNFKDIDNFKNKLIAVYPDVHISVLNTSHAFHSYMMDPVLEPFSKVLNNVKFNKSKIPFITNVTGTWAGKDEISSADYWLTQISSTVNFVDGVRELLDTENTYFIEVGPGTSLTTLVSQINYGKGKQNMSSTTRHPKQKINDVYVYLKSIGQAWASGVEINWDEYYKDEKRFRVPLPTYPFERKRHWIDPETIFHYVGEASNKEGLEEYFPDDEELTGPEVAEKSVFVHPRPDMDVRYIAPKTENEKIIAGIWENILGIKGIGLHDDFFFLGGHSILASQTIIRINERLHISLPFESLFEFPTINKLAERIESEKPEDIAHQKILSLDRKDKLPVSPDQKRLWIITQIDKNNPAYNIPFTYLLQGVLNKDVFIKSLGILFERQSILRSSIKSVNGTPYSFIHNYEELPVKILDFSSSPSENPEQRIQSFFTEESRKPFDIERGPLFRLFLVKMGREKYIFHMTVHHLIFDGWSWGIFAGELRQIYNNLLDQQQVSIKPLKYQYYDIAELKNRTITETYENSLSYWKTQLKDHPFEIHFPWDNTRKESMTGHGSRVTFKLSKAISEQIRMLNKEENTTNFMVLLAAFILLLNKYSGDSDICIGAPSANRTISEMEKIIGLFVNTIVLRLKIDPSQTFKEYLQLTRTVTLEALAHQDMPFEKLVEALQPVRKMNMNPIVQVVFAYQNTPRPPLALKGITPKRVLVKDTVAPFDITFYAWEDEDIIQGEIEFNTDILKSETILRMVGNLKYLLETVLSDTTLRIKDIEAVSESDRKKISLFNDTKAHVPDCLLQNLFEEQAILYPSRNAVTFKNSRLTYKELDQRSNQLARYIRSKKVQEGDVVGLCVNRSPEMIVSLLGILKAGCTYLPIDPTFPDERIKYILEDAKAGLLVTHSSLIEKFISLSKIPHVLIDKDRAKIKRRSKMKLDLNQDPFSPAYIIYTSGSTGRPKGVRVHHKGVVNMIESMTKVPGISREDRLLAVVTISFDMSVYELFMPLSNGAEIVIATTEETTDSSALINLIDTHNITLIQATPSFWNILLEGGWKGKKELKALSGGEKLTAGLIRDLLPKVKEFWNCYGPTETTVYATCKKITDPEATVVIGKPIANTTIHILDKHDKLLSIGVIGEVAIGGIGVAIDYYNHPELTESKFINISGGKRVYKTGDMGRYLSNGEIELFGRADNQIKLRGYRIEPGEIENLLAMIPYIKEAVVKARRFGENDNRLVAFVKSNQLSDFNKDEILRLLKQHLPPYMIPHHFQVVNEFPRTPNGKIDRNALSFRERDLIKDNIKTNRLLTETQQKIYKIWKDVLKTDGFGIEDNFFNIGGNSLLAIAVFNKMKKIMNVEMNLKMFFENPRIDDLARIVSIMKWKNTDKAFDRKSNKSGLNIITGEV